LTELPNRLKLGLTVRALALLLVLALVAPADAAPRADLVVVWAPGLRTAPLEAAAKRAGAAIVDKSPQPEAAAQTGRLVQRGIEAFDKLEFDQAWQLLEQARSEVDRSGAAGLTEGQLSDLFLYRGLIKAQQGDPNTSWDQLVTANTIGPTRELDPGRFAPRIRDEFNRARDTVRAKPRAKLTVQAPDNCTVSVDGKPTVGSTDRPLGPHWISTACPDRSPMGFKVELTGDVTVPVNPPPYAQPSDTDLLVQARAAGARAFVAVDVRSGVATARLVGLDGRERDRKTVQVAGDLGPLAEGLEALLAPPPDKHWYESRVVWAIGGAAAAAAILIPLTAFLTSDSSTTSVSARPEFPNGSPW
jgi:hypothetical protein